MTVVVVIDQTTKVLARGTLPLHQLVPVIGQWLGFRLTYFVPLTVLGSEALAIAAVAVVTPCVFLLVWRGSWSQLGTVAALGALLGGAFSSIVDRIYPQGSTHFLFAQLPTGYRIETNLAAIAFLIGAAYLLLAILRGNLPRERLGPGRGGNFRRRG